VAALDIATNHNTPWHLRYSVEWTTPFEPDVTWWGSYQRINVRRAVELAKVDVHNTIRCPEKALRERIGK
jgi:hypothetical protein